MRRGKPRKGRGLLRNAAFTFRDYAANVSPSPEPSAPRTRRVFGGGGQMAKVPVLKPFAKSGRTSNGRIAKVK